MQPANCNHGQDSREMIVDRSSGSTANIRFFSRLAPKPAPTMPITMAVSQDNGALRQKYSNDLRPLSIDGASPRLHVSLRALPL